jgi:RHS repeat-associated protein
MNALNSYQVRKDATMDFYPFGMIQPERTWESDKYRYGFNAKENDNEVKGTGNQQDYGMRHYDSRIGRPISFDPISKEFPQLSPYQFFSNNPILNIDLDGLEGLEWYMVKQMHDETMSKKTPEERARIQNQAALVVLGTGGAVALAMTAPHLLPYVAGGFLRVQAVTETVVGTVGVYAASNPTATGAILETVSSVFVNEPVPGPYSSGSLLPTVVGTVVGFVADDKFPQKASQANEDFRKFLMPDVITNEFDPGLAPADQTNTKKPNFEIIPELN